MMEEMEGLALAEEAVGRRAREEAAWLATLTAKEYVQDDVFLVCCIAKGAGIAALLEQLRKEPM